MKLDDVQRSSFAPLDRLIKESMDGFDLHVLVLKDPSEVSVDNDNLVKGLVIFN